MELTSKERKKLRGLAHHLDPVMLMGQHGITEAFIKAMDQALLSHELIKLKFNEGKETKDQLVQKLSDQTGASLVGLIGNVAIFYRAHPDPEKSKNIL